MKSLSKLDQLPVPIKKYIEQSGALGHPVPQTARIRQSGQFNIRGKKWRPLTAVQHFNFNLSSFSWKARSGIVHVVDEFDGNHGTLSVKLFNLIPLSKVSGPEMDEGEAQRYLAELIWFPLAFLSENILWESINSFKVLASINFGGKRAAKVNFHFNAQYEIIKITAKRFAENKGEFTLEDWEITNFKYKTINGINIPAYSEVYWNYSSGRLCYYKFEITDLLYSSHIHK